MECMSVHEKETRVRVLEWAGAECLYRVRVCRLKAWTAVLIQDVDTPNWGWEVVVRADQIAAQVCALWGVRPERLVLIWQEDECWPRWMAWLLGFELDRHFWIATQGTDVSSQATWKWMASDKDTAELLRGESLAEPACTLGEMASPSRGSTCLAAISHDTVEAT